MPSVITPQQRLVASRQRPWALTPEQHAAAGVFIFADDHVDPNSPFQFELQVLNDLPQSFAGIKLNREVANDRDVRRLMRKRFGQVFLDFDIGSGGEPMIAPLTDVTNNRIRPRWVSLSPDNGETGLKKAVATVKENVHSDYQIDLVVRSAPSNMTAEECRHRYDGRNPAEVAAWCAELATAAEIEYIQLAGPEIAVAKAINPLIKTVVVGARLPGEPRDGHDPARVWEPVQILDAGGDFISTGRQVMEAARQQSRQAAFLVGVAYLDNAAQAQRFQRSAR